MKLYAENPRVGRKYVLVVLHIDCTATVQKIKFLYMSLEEP